MVAPALALLYPTLLVSLQQANYSIFPDENGVPYLIKLDYTPLSQDHLDNLAANVNSISFTLYTRSNPISGQVILLGNANSLANTHWKSNRPSYFVIHGWKSSGTSSVATLVRNAFLAAADCNMIVIDWSAIASNSLYPQVAQSVPAVAEHVASFINFLRTQAKLRPDLTKIVGHSLGAHIASLSARIVSKSSLVAEVVALDPASPMFEENGPDSRVDRSHAKNVQVVHTAAGLLGMKKAVGTSDFFMNGGNHQPGCTGDMLGSCSHGRSYEYFSESVMKPRGFAGTPMNGGSKAYMGGLTLDPNARGSYTVKTASHSPYALGG